MPVTLRPLVSDSLLECFKLEVGATQRHEAQIEETPDLLLNMLKEEGCVPLTIHHEEQMVGFIAYSQYKGTSDYEIPRFLIDERYQGRGYGESALRQVIAQISERHHCDRIVIGYMSFNAAATRLYAKVGFIETDEFQRPEALDHEGGRFAVLCLTEQAQKAELARLQGKIDEWQAQIDALTNQGTIKE